MSVIPRRRFLFLYSATGAGHHAAALAVRDALQQRYGSNAEITLCDGLQALHLWPLDRFPRWWPHMVRLGGVPWGAFYRLTNTLALQQALARLLLPVTGDAVERLLDDNPTDVVVSFHPLFTHTFGRVLQRRTQPAPLASVVLDLVSIHAAWCSPDCARILYLRPPLPRARSPGVFLLRTWSVWGCQFTSALLLPRAWTLPPSARNWDCLHKDL